MWQGLDIYIVAGLGFHSINQMDNVANEKLQKEQTKHKTAQAQLRMTSGLM